MSNSEFDVDPAMIAEHLIELAARTAVLENVLRHTTALTFSAGPGGAAAFDAMSSVIIADLRCGTAPPGTSAEIAEELRVRSTARAQAFLHQAAEIRCGISDERGGPLANS